MHLMHLGPEKEYPVEAMRKLYKDVDRKKAYDVAKVAKVATMKDADKLQLELTRLFLLFQSTLP